MVFVQLKENLSHIDYLQVTDSNSSEIFCGIDQEWFPTERQRLTGCGPSAAANILFYIDRKDNSGCCGRNRTDLLASFERICLSRYLREHYPSHFLSYGSEGDTIGKYLDPLSWKCSQVLASSLGFPLSLKDLGEALGLSEKKMDEGSRLIGLFSLPGPEGRRMPEGYLEEWALFKKYNRRDVEVERAVRRSFSSYKTPAVLWDEYHEDQRINDRGIPVDIPFVHAAMAMGDRAQMELLGRLKHLTGLLNPKSPCQMKDWLSANGTHAESLCIDANEFPVIPFPDIVRIIIDLCFIAADLVIMVRGNPGIARYSPLLPAVNRSRRITADGGRDGPYCLCHFSPLSFLRALGRRLDGVGV